MCSLFKKKSEMKEKESSFMTELTKRLQMDDPVPAVSVMEIIHLCKRQIFYLVFILTV